MNTFPLLVGALCVYAIGYRYYSAFIAARALALDDRRTTPAHAFEDGHNYVPSPRWVLFGHHFAAIAGAGPLVGPTLAAQFGFAPGFLWLLIGAVLAGCVQDFTVLVASVRHRGRSLADVARTEISPFAGLVVMIAVLFILLVSLAGLGIVVVNALANSPWGVFTIGTTIPIALIMGVWMFRSHTGRIAVTGPSIFGVVLLLSAVVGGHWFAQSSAAHALTFTPHQITILMAAYGFVAAVLPVWLLLAPRGYLSTYVKLGTIAILVVGVFIVHPDIRFPAVTPFIHGGGPIIKGSLFPFLFVTIACGAISGFHSLVASGTTPKMLDKETDARVVGYGAMACESLVGVLALIAATSMYPGDYFAINSTPEVFRTLGLHTVTLDTFSREVGEKLAGRTGGAVSGISRWWRVVGGLSMNLALGTLYAWSVFVAPLEKQFGWKRADTSMVFTIAVVVFALTFVVAGRIQDKIGPLYCSLAGGVLVSLGFFLCSYTTSLTYLFICFGVIGGLGNGFGYATPIPVMAKWFPDKRGLAIGLAVGGYGAGSAIFGPLAQLKLIPQLRASGHLQILGGIFLVMTLIGAFLLKNPPAGYKPAGWTPAVGFQIRRHHLRIQPRRSAAHAGVLPDVGGLRAGLLRRTDGDQPTGAVRQERGHRGRGACPP
jgi:carbon starvation protein CstA